MGPQPSARGRFWRFSVRQLLVLFAVFSALLAILAPRVQNTLRAWKAERELYDTFIAPQVALNRAIVQGQGPDRVREALEAGAKVSIPIHEGVLPLHCAITLGRCESVQVLLDHGADVERSELYDPSRRTVGPPSRGGPALFAAIDCDQPTNTKIQMLNILLDHSADIRCQVGHENLMDLAARYGDGAIGDLLRSNGLPYGPREMAAFNRIEEMQRAIEESPDLLHERFKPRYLVGRQKEGRWQVAEGETTTLLGIAISKSYRDMARMLIEAGAPLGAVEPLGQTPLHIAATRGGDPALIRLLITRGADVNAMDDNQLTPLAASRQWSGREAARAALIKAGAR